VADRFGLKLVSIKDLIAYRIANGCWSLPVLLIFKYSKKCLLCLKVKPLTR
jgi:hypothetical protein